MKKKKSLAVPYKRFRELYTKEKLNPKSVPNERNSCKEEFFVQRAKKDFCVTKPLSPAFHQSENTSLTVNVYIMVVFYHHLIFLSLTSLVSRNCSFDHSTDYTTCLSIFQRLKYSSRPFKPPCPQIRAIYVPLKAEVYNLWSDMFQTPYKISSI